MHHWHTILASLGRREETHREATQPSHEIKILNIRKQNRSQRVSQKNYITFKIFEILSISNLPLRFSHLNAVLALQRS